MSRTLPEYAELTASRCAYKNMAERAVVIEEAFRSVLRSVLTDNASGRPQCRGCYEYVDLGETEQKHADRCWAGEFFRNPTP